MIKKIYLFLLIPLIFLISCNSSSNSSTNSILNPPTWIHGTWSYSFTASEKISYKFSSDNVYLVTGGVQMSLVTLTSLSGGSISDSESVDQYNLLNVKMETSQPSTNLVFKKLTDSTLSYSEEGSPVTITLTKE